MFQRNKAYYYIKTTDDIIDIFFDDGFIIVMGGKNKRPKRHVEYVAPRNDVNREELALEAIQLHELLQHRTSILQSLEEGTLCYLLSTRWLDDWKSYVGYYKLISDDGSSKKVGKRHPGKINFSVSNATTKYHQIPKELPQYEYLNQHINQKEDYIPVTEQIWQAFASKYEHIIIRRPIRKIKKSYYQSTTIQCQLTFIDARSQQLLKKIHQCPKKEYINLLNVDYMQLPDVWTYEQLEIFLKKYCLTEFKKEDIRIWKCYSYLGSNPVCQSMLESIKNQKYQIKGTLLEKQALKNLDIDEFIKSTYLLVIQIEQNFSSEPEQQQIVGYCEECIQKKKSLAISCVCKRVHYCSQKCKVEDTNFHKHTCERVFESDDDEDYQKPFDNSSELYVNGLENIGNTCYMNSALQCIFSINFLKQFFCSNVFLQQKDKNHKQKFLQKFSKTIKKTSEGTVIPWSLKRQIQYFLPPFKGFKQHDANDFLINFLNTLNQFLAKEGDSIYSSFFKNNFIGSFISTVICPVCNFQNITNDIFMQISLPIKQKIQNKSCNYLIIKSPTIVIKGKMQIKKTWSLMKSELKLEQNCLMGQYKDNFGIVQIQQQIVQPQKYFTKNKQQINFYPNTKTEEGITFFTLSLITFKKILQNNVKSTYGHQILFGLQTKLNSLGTFLLNIVCYFNPEGQIYDEAIAIKNEYFDQINSSFEKDSSCLQTKEQNMQQNENKNKQQAIIQRYNEKLELFLQKVGISIYVYDLNRKRGVCRFCLRKCQSCLVPRKIQTQFQSYFESNDIRFQILLNPKPQIQIQTDDKFESGDATLKDCFEQFKQPQQLDEQNAWYCAACQDMRLALKKMQISQYPRVLIIHLNRFKSEGDKKIKNNDPVVYNQVEIFGKNKYQLVGVIVHQGSMEGGHYWAICKRGELFYIFNDQKVTPTQKVINKGAYVLIYVQI